MTGTSERHLDSILLEKNGVVRAIGRFRVIVRRTPATCVTLINPTILQPACTSPGVVQTSRRRSFTVHGSTTSENCGRRSFNGIGAAGGASGHTASCLMRGRKTRGLLDCRYAGSVTGLLHPFRRESDCLPALGRKLCGFLRLPGCFQRSSQIPVWLPKKPQNKPQPQEATNRRIKKPS